MGCGPEAAGSVYHPRQPQQTPFYQLVARFYPQFEAVYPERDQARYGFWRPIIGTVVGKFWNAAISSRASPTAREARKGWAALVKQVYEADPLLCPRCGATMRIIAFIERHQTEVIEKILRHCGLWEEEGARGPPPTVQKARA
jgi:hypothetical protein